VEAELDSLAAGHTQIFRSRMLHWLGIRWDRTALNVRIEKRIHEMVERGWLREVKELLAAGYGPQLKSMSALGYRYMAQHLEGSLSLTQAIEKTFIATRRYAKRQMTWFARMPAVTWFDGPVSLELVEGWLNEQFGTLES
jgi:tRNA delta(2)-isopentenylpyrophosphate transferase